MASRPPLLSSTEYRNRYPAKTEPMIKNTTHSSIGCNGMANNDEYHGLENNEVEQNTGKFGMYDNIRPRHEVRQLGQNNAKPPLPQWG